MLDAESEGQTEHELISVRPSSGDVNPRSQNRVEDLTWKERIEAPPMVESVAEVGCRE
jgi:hypothetical protein